MRPKPALLRKVTCQQGEGPTDGPRWGGPRWEEAELTGGGTSLQTALSEMQKYSWQDEPPSMGSLAGRSGGPWAQPGSVT